MWDNFMQEVTPQMWQMIGSSTLETVYMGFFATLMAVVVGLPIGFLAFLTGKGEILENPRLHQVLDVIINIGRSVPFIILLIVLLPFTRLLVGTTLGTTAAIVPLSVSAIPFFARLTANALLEVPTGLTEAAKSMGATNWQVVTKFYLPESLPILINGVTLTLVSLIGYSAMAGAVGGGGLGNLAIQYAKKVFNAHVVAIDINQDKLDLALEVGADVALNAKDVKTAEYIQEHFGGAHAAVVTAVSKDAFNDAINAVRAAGKVVAVGLPSETMDLPIVKAVLDGIEVIGSLVGTRKDLEEAFQFGAEGLVVPIVQKRPLDDVADVFAEMEAGTIQGRMVLDMKQKCACGHHH